MRMCKLLKTASLLMYFSQSAGPHSSRVNGVGLLRSEGRAVVRERALKEKKSSSRSSSSKRFCGEQNLVVEVDIYRDEEIEVVLDVTDTSDNNVLNKAKTQTEKSLKKAFRQFMMNSEEFAENLKRADIKDFEDVEKERIMFDNPNASRRGNKITVTYDMPTFPASFRYVDCGDVSSKVVRSSEEKISDALGESIKEDTHRFSDYFESDLKENNWNFSNLKIKN